MSRRTLLAGLLSGLLWVATACASGGPSSPEPGPTPPPGEPEEAQPQAPPEELPDLTGHPVPVEEPTVRVGLSIGADSVVLVGRDGLEIAGLAPDRTIAIGSDERRTVRPSGEGVEVVGPGGDRSATFRRIVVAPAGASPVQVDGAAYRGRVELYLRSPHGLVVVNQLEMETYLRGVVPMEIGPRVADEHEAVKAQAVAARTYAVRNLGRRDSLGFDLFGSVEDQVYGGRDVERGDANRAVASTEGRVLVYEGEPIRAYYHSTGGGWTARVSDVWNLPDAPYLRRVSDRRPEGGDYCDASPRYRWEERWTPSELDASVHEGLVDYFALDDDATLGSVRSVEVLDRAGKDRIQRLAVRTDRGRYVVARNDIRFFLRTPDGRSLRSTRFEVVDGPEDGRGLALTGRGFGHGIGMCQWGAIGRARAGQSHREILTHYYPGTELIRAYGGGAQSDVEPDADDADAPGDDRIESANGPRAR